MPKPHVQVVVANEHIPPTLESALRRAGASASFRPLSEALRTGVTATADAIVVVAPEDARPILPRLRVLLERLADHPRATLIVREGSRVMPRFAHPETLPVCYADGLAEDELAVRLSTMLDMRASLDSLHRGMTATRASEQHATRRYQNQLRLASQLQREFLPEALPRYGPVNFAALYRPAEYVSGDIYDVQRLDETHVGLALADATGHGIPAALLTVFIKRALRGKEIVNGHYRILEPHEVLARLNHDILEANLTECRFVAATYAVLDLESLELSIARGGSPYPMLRRADGRTELLRPSGGVVGVVSDAEFSLQTVQLAPGDALLVYSDGLEKLVSPTGPAHGPAEPAKADDSAAGLAWPLSGQIGGTEYGGLAMAPVGPALAECLAPDELLVRSSWFETLQSEGTAIALDQLHVRYNTFRRLGHHLDDLTVLTLQVDPLARFGRA